MTSTSSSEQPIRAGMLSLDKLRFKRLDRWINEEGNSEALRLQEPSVGTLQEPSVETFQADKSLESCPEESLGKVIDKRFRIVSRLGAGGMGDVYKAEHLILQKLVALKILNDHQINQLNGIQRFQQEAKAISSLSHKNIVRVFSFGYDAPRFYMAMDFVDGPSLQQVLQDQGKLDFGRVIELCLQIASGLEHAHERGVIHRDLKPANIILQNSSEPGSEVKIVDFGVARFTADSGKTQKELTLAGRTCGSPPYMSPEQCLGEQVDARSDIYSLGCMVYEMLSGSRPFSAESSIELMQKHVEQSAKSLKSLGIQPPVPDLLEAVVRKCMSKKPDLRYQSMSELIDDLQAVKDQCLPFDSVDTGASKGNTPKRAQQNKNAILLKSSVAVFMLCLLGCISLLVIPGVQSELHLLELKKELEQIPRNDPQRIEKSYLVVSKLIKLHERNKNPVLALSCLKDFENEIKAMPLSSRRFGLQAKLIRNYARMDRKKEVARLFAETVSGLEDYMSRCEREYNAIELELSVSEYLRLVKNDKDKINLAMSKFRQLIPYRVFNHQYLEGERLARTALQILKEQGGGNKTTELVMLTYLATALMPQKKYQESQEALEKAWQLCQENWTVDNETFRSVATQLSNCYLAQGKVDSSRALLNFVSEKSSSEN